MITFRLRAHDTLGPIGTSVSYGPAEQRKVKTITAVGVGLVFAVVLSAMTGIVRINPIAVAENMRNVMLAMAILYFAYLFLAAWTRRRRSAWP